MTWPTTDDPRTEFVTLRLTKTEDADLRLHADANGKKRSEYVRDAVSRVIAADKRKAARVKAAGTTPGAGLDGEDHTVGVDRGQ